MIKQAYILILSCCLISSLHSTDGCERVALIPNTKSLDLATRDWLKSLGTCGCDKLIKRIQEQESNSPEIYAAQSEMDNTHSGNSVRCAFNTGVAIVFSSLAATLVTAILATEYSGIPVTTVFLGGAFILMSRFKKEAIAEVRSALKSKLVITALPQEITLNTLYQQQTVATMPPIDQDLPC